MLRKILTSSLLTLIALGGFFVSNNTGKNYLTTASAQTITNDDGSTLTINNDGTSSATNATDRITETEPNAIKDMYNKLVAGLNLFLGILTMVVSPAIMLAGWLMSPDWTSGDLFGLRAVMYKLWVTISNITYFIYAILLIFIALATIFGRENYGYKAMLPKLALGIILVPFTWWFVQWTISLTSVITASVISIPHEALSELNAGSSSWWTTQVIPKKIEVNNGKDWDKVFEGCGKTQLCLSPQEFLSNSSGMYGYMMVYAYGVFKIQEVKKLETVTDQIGAITQIIHSSFIAILMFLIFGILTLALVFMLLARAVMLWVYTIFSPFLTLELVMGGMMKKVSDDFSIKEFVGLAFVPALVGLALSFGLVVVAAVQTPNTGSNPQIGSSNGTCDGPLLRGNGCIIANIMGNPNNQIIRQLKNPTTETKDSKTSTTFETWNTVKFGDVDFIFIGKATGASDQDVIDKQGGGVNGAVSIINSAGGIFGTIIVDIIALLFIWMAFMAAKGVSKVVDAAAKPFQEMGESIGKLGASLPKYTPIPGLGVSPKGMSKLTQEFATSIDSSATERSYESPLAKALGVDQDTKAVVQDQARIAQALQAGKIDNLDELRKLQENTRKVVAMYGLSSAQGQKALTDMAKILENSGRKHEGELFSGSEIKDGGLWVLQGDITSGNSGNRRLTAHDKDKALWKSKQKEYSGGTTNQSAGYSVSETVNKLSYVFTMEGKTVTLNKDIGDVSKMDTDNAKNAFIAKLKTDEFKGTKLSREKIKAMLDSLGRNDSEALSKSIYEELPPDRK